MEDLQPVDVVMQRPHLVNIPTLPPLRSNYVLKRLGSQHESALAELLSIAFEEAWDVSRVQTALTQADDVKACYGIFQDDRLLATASSQIRPEYAEQAGFVHWVATHPDYRRQGLAVALLGQLLEDFQRREYHAAMLITQATRSAAIRAYLQFGFIPEYVFKGQDHRVHWSRIFQTII